MRGIAFFCDGADGNDVIFEPASDGPRLTQINKKCV